MQKRELSRIRTRIQKWVNALESGEFKKGRRKLHIENNGKDYYCCLGVANKVCGLKETNDGVLMRSRLKLGLSEVNGEYVTKYDWQSLTRNNDERDFSLRDNAKVIRSNPKGLFIDEVAQYLKENPLEVSRPQKGDKS